jgi:hypothetical protein
MIDRVVATLHYDSGPGDMEISIVTAPRRRRGAANGSSASMS